MQRPNSLSVYIRSKVGRMLSTTILQRGVPTFSSWLPGGRPFVFSFCQKPHESSPFGQLSCLGSPSVDVVVNDRSHCFFHGRHCGVAADGLGVVLLEDCDNFKSEFAMAFPSQSDPDPWPVIRQGSTGSHEVRKSFNC
ncbi:uncharacterized protein LOC106011266 [Aplysia californica]|uniref:Uncharacterized protein LOC106011266 n=1 Tax=Aplysia californica TaxID=6500 RepID=A0ABM0ZW62_APLCA|nr:uncharacterized protein LOC106011266 [Aplysia californica]